jgi:hypothetical protein
LIFIGASQHFPPKPALNIPSNALACTALDGGLTIGQDVDR